MNSFPILFLKLILIDILGNQKLAFFFKVIGMNSILFYILGNFINWNYTANGFFEWLSQLFGEPSLSVVMTVCLILIKWVFLYFLYKKEVFLKV